MSVLIRLGPAALADASMPRPLTAGGMRLILIRNGDRLMAAERACPHDGADLAMGHCAGGRLHCPRHQASFDLATGVVSPGWFFRALRVFPVEVRDDGLWIAPAAAIRD